MNYRVFYVHLFHGEVPLLCTCGHDHVTERRGERVLMLAECPACSASGTRCLGYAATLTGLRIEPAVSP